MHVLVTGGCGYVGTILVPKLLALGIDVTVADIMWFGNYLNGYSNLKIKKADVRDIDSIPMDGIDTVIHLANISNDPCGDLDAKLSWEVNALATMRLVERAIANRVKQFIFASSGSVYGVKDELKVTEDLPLVPITDYNKTKMISERILLSYKDDILVKCIRPATVCGYSPRMRLDLSVNMLTMQALANKRITVFGGDQTRPNIHIQDITDVFIYMMQKEAECTGIYNAGFENLSIMEIAKRVTDLAPAEIVVTESNDPRSYRLNSDRLLSTGFTPKHNVAEAMEEIVDAFNKGVLKMEDKHFNLKTMKSILK